MLHTLNAIYAQPYIYSTLELTLRMLDIHIDGLYVIVTYALYGIYGIYGIYGLLVLSVYFRHT